MLHFDFIVVALFILNFLIASGEYNIVVQNNVQPVEFGKTAKLSWKAELDDQTVSGVEILFKDNQNGEHLWRSSNSAKNNFAKYFGQRASITKSTEENWEIKLTIESVQPNDTFTFFLLGQFSDKLFNQKENRNASIVVQPKGLQKIQDMPSSTDTSSSVSILLNAEPKPTIKWTVNGETKLGGDAGILENVEEKQYKFTYQLNTLQAKDCGHNLTYVATGYNGKKIQGTSRVNVLFTPSPITVAQFYQISKTVNCQQLEWTAVEAGKCVNGVEYKIAIKNGADTLTFSTFGNETSLSICNATAAESATVLAVYNGMFGPKSNEVIFLEKKPTTTQSTTTASSVGRIKFELVCKEERRCEGKDAEPQENQPPETSTIKKHSDYTELQPARKDMNYQELTTVRDNSAYEVNYEDTYQDLTTVRDDSLNEVY